MESWRQVWRSAVAPLLSDRHLEVLERALACNDRRLIQGGTTSPPPMRCIRDWPVDQACPLAFAGWQGDGLPDVEAAEEFFARACFSIDQQIGEPGGCRFFLNWWDEEPREVVFPLLLAEVRQEQQRRTHDNRP
jgi:hypothetical protein